MKYIVLPLMGAAFVFLLFCEPSQAQQNNALCRSNSSGAEKVFPNSCPAGWSFVTWV